jgi:hypothetical protein
VGVYNYISFAGLAPRAWPGDVVVIADLAYRLCVRKNLFVFGVADWGYAWAQGDFSIEKQTALDFFRHAPLGVGAGMAWNTVIGPVSLMWGRILVNMDILRELNVSDQNVFYLSAGHDF